MISSVIDLAKSGIDKVFTIFYLKKLYKFAQMIIRGELFLKLKHVKKLPLG
jgi:hypothetical protein